MPGPARYFGTFLEAAVTNWQIDQRQLDDAARRMLRLISRAGVMDDQPQNPGTGESPEHREVAREVAAESMVLLKNDDDLLPLDAL